MGYMIAWPQTDGYFIDNIAVDPAWQSRGFGLVDGMVPPLVVCLVGITGAAHVLRYRPPDLLVEHVGGEHVPPINILVVDRIGWSRRIVITHDDVALH